MRLMEKVTAPGLLAQKGSGRGLSCLTAYDFTFAQLADEAGVDMILVGDSLANTMLGFETTLGADLDAMVHHTAAVCRGVKHALVIADMPFGSYQASEEKAVESAVALMRAGAGAVKLEGAYTGAIRAILKAGIPVMGHLGFTPQSVHAFGGHKMQGKGETGENVLADAKALDEAGVFGMVLELIPSALAEKITAAVAAVTIGIGAGAQCDGQVQVMHDLLGLSAVIYRHAMAYTDLRKSVLQAFSQFTQDVSNHTLIEPGIAVENSKK